MAKGILIMDIPESCHECPLFSDHYLDMCCRGLSNRTIEYPYPKDFRQEWCPLKNIPQKLRYGEGHYHDYVTGWNKCIEEILKECIYE